MRLLLEVVLDLVFRPDNKWPWLLTGLSEPLERDSIACYPLGTDANSQIKTFLMR